MLLLTVLTVLGFLYWGTMALLLRRVMRAVPLVRELSGPPPAQWPRVSVIMPARNEERTLEPALRSKLKETYPELELILVDDRSTDATGAVAEAFARTEPRLQVVHVDTLPEGWLGKVHAMQRGYERASGEWVLFSDADIHLEPGVLERVVAYAKQEQCDHVCILPTVTCSGRWLGFKPGSAWIPFLGVLPLAWAIIRSGALALVRGGVMWRETFYPTPVVRAGLRLGPGARSSGSTPVRAA